jgi:hypothetical protein
MTARERRNLIGLWLTWSIILIGYMHLAPARYAPDRPDDSLVWTAGETGRRSNIDKPYLRDPFLNPLVAWDSEYYLSVSIAGYADPTMRTFTAEDGTAYPLSHAFFPLYPALMSLVRVPFAALTTTPIAASAAAGVAISLIGTLAGMIALYDIVRGELGIDGAFRTVFLLLIFPMSLFFAVIYTEGLFIGLAFTSMALMRRQQLLAAAILAVLATWTRAVGGALIIPLALAWFAAYRAADDKRGAFIRLPLVALPALAYLAWRAVYGVPFEIVETGFFGNGLLNIPRTLDAWTQILERARTNPQTAVVVALNAGGIALALISIPFALRRYPGLALFSLAALAIPLTGGWTGTQSGFRYVLVAPALWIFLGRLTRYPVIERAWTLLSILLLAMLAYLFAFDFWVA